MLIINGKEIKGYEDYSKLNSNDILIFMKDQSVEDIQEFKNFAKTVKTVTYKDGSKKEFPMSFFELRNWVLDKYAPGIRTPKKRTTTNFLDRIAAL